MNIGTYSTNNFSKLLWLVIVAVAVFFFSTGTWVYNKVLDGSDQKVRMYQTAIKIEDEKQFNYSIDTHQGNILAWGNFEAVEPAKFAEMSKKYLAVEKVTERYTRHESETCWTDINGFEQCTTTVWYSWDWFSSTKVESPEVKLNGRTYPTNLFHFTLKRVHASEIIPGATNEYWYPHKKDWLIFTSEGDIRYAFNVVDIKTAGSILANTSGGALRPAEGSKIAVSNKQVSERVKEAQNAANASKWGFIIAWTVLTIGAVVLTIRIIYDEEFA